jgi:hypothetical protein
VSDEPARRSPVLAGCATFALVTSIAGGLVAWNARVIRSWLDPSYRDPADVSAVEQVLRARYRTANLSVFWTTRTPPGARVRLAPEQRRRVGVHVVDSPRMPDLAAADAVAAEIAREVRASAGPATRVEVVLMNRATDGPGWQRRSFWFEAQP